MAIDASELLGAPQVAGVRVTARGATMGRALNQGGVAAGGLVPKLSFSFADGSNWSMDVPRVVKK
jgi:hypothetical protein